MDFVFENKWKRVISRLEDTFGEDMDIEAILFLIGVQELGRGPGKFSKDEKLNLIHIGICAILEPYGYYEFDRVDGDGWPHFTTVKKLPYLKDKEQKELMKKAIVEYFEQSGDLLENE